MSRPTPLPRDNHRPGWSYLPASPHRLTTTVRVVRSTIVPKGIRSFWALSITWFVMGAITRRYGNINPLSIDYACRPRLRSRLTQGGLAWPWNPWSFGGRVSHPSFATHACILTRVALHGWVHPAASLATRRSPTHPHAWTTKA
jgi:hypothetical protein